MKTKDNIRNDPYEVIKIVQRPYNHSTRYVEIELINQNDNLYLFSHTKGMRIGNERSIHRYDADGKHFFNDLMENFGRAWVMIPGERPIEFDSYEALLNKITSD